MVIYTTYVHSMNPYYYTMFVLPSPNSTLALHYVMHSNIIDIRYGAIISMVILYKHKLASHADDSMQTID